MRRAAELFVFDEWDSGSRFVEKTWRTHSEPEPTFISVAASHWEIVVTRRRGVAQVTIRGPETRATVVPVPGDAEFFGFEFSVGTFMPGLPLASLVDRGVTLANATPASVWLDGVRWEIPRPENADVFVDRLVQRGLVVRDSVAVDALRGEVEGISTRTVERRVARATGLTRGVIRQISRAEEAVAALGRGVSPREVASLLGYADQAHLTRSLKRFVGQTPSEVAGPSRAR